MKKRTGMEIVYRGKGVPAAATTLKGGALRDGALRDGTTGRPVVVPRLWAVGEEVQRTDASPLALVTRATEQPTRLRPELAFYRKYTEAMLRRWVKLAMSPGRVPSLLGREMFRGKVSSYAMHGFDDAVIFCVDMERAVDRLEKEDRELIRRIAVQEFSQGEAATLLGMSLRDVVRKYGAAVDRLTGILLAQGMLESLRTEAEKGAGAA